MMVRGVRQTAVNFSDHELVAPAATEVEARGALKRILFDNVIRLLKGQITGMRHARTEAEKTAAARDPRTNIDNPEVYLDMLVEQLSLPARLIRLQDRMLRVSKLGIMLPTHASEASNQVRHSGRRVAAFRNPDRRATILNKRNKRGQCPLNRDCTNLAFASSRTRMFECLENPGFLCLMCLRT